MQKRRTFDEWKAKVNQLVQRRFAGLDCDSLPDMDYYEAYRQGESPSKVLAKLVRMIKQGY